MSACACTDDYRCANHTFYIIRQDLDGRWVLWMRNPGRRVRSFVTQAEAIDHAHRNWPWYP